MNATDFDMTRRRLFQAVGVGAAGVAGVTSLGACKADPGVKDLGAFHGAYPYETPPDGHFNIGGYPYTVVPRVFLEGLYMELLCMTPAYQYWDSGEWEYMLAESHEVDEEENLLTIKVREGLEWSDGEPLTSKDFMTTMWMNWLRNNPMWASVEKIDAPDDTTFTVKLKNPSAVIERYILRSPVVPTHSVGKEDDEDGLTYGDYAEEAQKIFDDGKDTDSDEFSDLAERFGKFRPEKLITSGPYTLEEKDFTDTKLTMHRSDEGFAGDTVKFEKIVVYAGETTQVEPLVASKDVDYASHGFSPSQERKFEQEGARIVRPPNYSGPALKINLKDVPEFEDVRARQALAHAINREDAGKIALGDSGPAVKLMSGMSDIYLDDWVSKEDQDDLNPYEYDQDKAAELLEDAGWTKEGDTWMTPDGKAAEYEIKWPGNYADYSGAGDSIADQLTEFGIKLTPNPIDEEQYLQEIDTGEFEMMIAVWGSSQHPHPHFAYVANLLQHNTPFAKNQGGDGIAFDLNVDSETEGELDLEELTNEAGEGLDEEEQKAKVTTLAKVFNELLPIIPICERYANSPVFEGEGARVKAFPDDDDPVYRNSTYADNPIAMMLLKGEIEPSE